MLADKVGIPVSIGLETSKTLAKLASDKAKSNNGIFVIPPDKILDIVGEMPIEDVSGIGRKNSEHMKFSGIFTIKDFVEKDNGWIRKAFGINGLNLKNELTGIEHLWLTMSPPRHKAYRLPGVLRILRKVWNIWSTRLTVTFMRLVRSYGGGTAFAKAWK